MPEQAIDSPLAASDCVFRSPILQQGQTSLIVYVQDRTPTDANVNYTDLYVMHPNGSGKTALIECTGMVTFFRPRISPDGRMVAFIASNLDVEQGQIYVLRIDGTTFEGNRPYRQVTGLPLQARALTWSPDSHRIAFIAPSSTTDSTAAQIYTVDVQGTETSIPAPSLLSGAVESIPFQFLDWIPVQNGTQIIYTRHISVPGGIEFRLYQVSYTSGVASSVPVPGLNFPITGLISHARWSPNGQQIAFIGSSTTTGNGLFIFNTATGTYNLWKPGSQIYRLAWSPDGSQLMFSMGGIDRFHIASLSSPPGILVLTGTKHEDIDWGRRTACGASGDSVNSSGGVYICQLATPMPTRTPTPTLFQFITNTPSTPTATATLPPATATYQAALALATVFPLPMQPTNITTQQARLSDLDFVDRDGAPPLLCSRDVNPILEANTGYNLIAPAVGQMVIIDETFGTPTIDDNYSAAKFDNKNLGRFIAFRINVSDMPEQIVGAINARYPAIAPLSETGWVYIGYAHLNSIEPGLSIEHRSQPDAFTTVELTSGQVVGTSGSTSDGLSISPHLDVSVFYTAEQLLPTRLGNTTLGEGSLDQREYWRGYVRLFGNQSANLERAYIIDPLLLWPLLADLVPGNGEFASRLADLLSANCE